jgi:hypothetical protein
MFQPNESSPNVTANNTINLIFPMFSPRLN